MKKTLLILFSIVAVALIIFLARAETVPQSQTNLKGYFNPTGAVPGTNAYNEFIDTMFWYANFFYTNAQSAAISAALAQQASSAAVACFSFNCYSLCQNPEVVQIVRYQGFASNVVNVGSAAPCNPGATIFLTNWFSVPLTNPFAFYVLQTPFGTNGIIISSSTLNSNYFAISFDVTAPNSVGNLYTNGYYWITFYQ